MAAPDERDLSTLEPATITHIDFRPPEARETAAKEVASAAAAVCEQQQPAPPPQQQQQQEGRPLRLVTWNIERGYELPKVIALLKEVDADILSLQELDIGCDRSSGADTFSAIGQALGLNGLFLCEFQELHSPLRDARSQGGGVHGNAVFSRYDFASWKVLEHTHHPINWEAPTHPLAAKEPRRGRRTTLAADVVAPGGAVRVYCTHLEVFCGILARVWQFSDIFRDVKAPGAAAAAAIAAGQGVAGEVDGAGAGTVQQQKGGAVPTRFAILGDLNTMANGVARLSPNYCCDALRWRTLGTSEAQYWQRHVFSCMGDDPSLVNTHFQRWGLPAAVCRDLVNPGFFDPFDPAADITLDNAAYRLGPFSLMTGKLDWALLKGLRSVAWRMANLDWAASDHRMLIVEAQ